MEEEDDDSRLEALLDEQLTECAELTSLLCLYWMPFICKQPRRTSQRTGHLWVQEILSDTTGRCHEMFRVDTHVFYLLCDKLMEHGLRNSTHVGVEEMVAMFLVTVGHGMGNRLVQELFQHSGETVSHHLHRVLNACLRLAEENIKPMDPQFHECHPHISGDSRYHPYFKDAIGAIDGTHIRCAISGPDRVKYIGRKGYPSQNVMAVCDWDMCFTFVLAGWEGSAHDARVFHAAVSNAAMNFPHPPSGKYYLVDAGYPTREGYLGPYKRECYHVPEFRSQPVFQNDNETFNFFHSSLRSTIERTFGVWKNRFAILEKMRKYNYDTQVRLVCATMAIHNFIRRNVSCDVDFNGLDNENMGQDADTNVDDDVSCAYNVGTSTTTINEIRDKIRDEIARNL